MENFYEKILGKKQLALDFSQEMNMIRSQKVNVDRYGMVSLVDNIFISKSRKLLTKTLTYSDFLLSTVKSVYVNNIFF